MVKKNFEESKWEQTHLKKWLNLRLGLFYLHWSNLGVRERVSCAQAIASPATHTADEAAFKLHIFKRLSCLFARRACEAASCDSDGQIDKLVHRASIGKHQSNHIQGY